MRINLETLMKIAKETSERRARTDRDLLAVYLHGSLLEGDPLLGGTTDIDLVFIHFDEVLTPREIQRLTDEVHLDIAHHARREYHQARSLRLHPWIGPTLFAGKVLYDPQHFLDFTQASVRSQFNRPDYVLGRAYSQAKHARQMWLSLHEQSDEPGWDEVELYLRAVGHVANAVASLSGAPLTERRLLLKFPARAEAVAKPGLYAGLLGLLGGSNVDGATLQSWLSLWEEAYRSVPVMNAPARLHPERRLYYQRAMEKILESERPQNILWTLLNTWTQAIGLMPADAKERQAWQEIVQHLGLWGEEFRQRVNALDAYLDNVEEVLEQWGRHKGVEYPPEQLIRSPWL